MTLGAIFFAGLKHSIQVISVDGGRVYKLFTSPNARRARGTRDVDRSCKTGFASPS
jgi:hypothetical protein